MTRATKSVFAVAELVALFSIALVAATVLIAGHCQPPRARGPVPTALVVDTARDSASTQAKRLTVANVVKGELLYVDGAGRTHIADRVSRDDLAAWIVGHYDDHRNFEERATRDRDDCLERERRRGWRMDDRYEAPQLEALR